MAPLFSIVIPTRNRPALARAAIAHVLQQTFSDFELLVLENSDRPELFEQGFDDARVKVLPSARVLPMPDNWERGLDHVSGRYVLYLSDKDLTLPYALAELSALIAESSPAILNYRKALLHEGFLSLQRCSQGVAPLATGPVLREWFGSVTHVANAPMIYNSAVRRAEIVSLREKYGRLFTGIAPDVSSSVLLAASVDEYLLVDRIYALSYSGAWSIGASPLLEGRRGTGSGFLSEFGEDPMERAGLVWSVPGGVAETLMACQRLAPELLAGQRLDWKQYLEHCVEELEAREKRGVDAEADRRFLAEQVGKRYPLHTWLMWRAGRIRRLWWERSGSAAPLRNATSFGGRAARKVMRIAGRLLGRPARPHESEPPPFKPQYFPPFPVSGPEEALAKIMKLRTATRDGSDGEFASSGAARTHELSDLHV